MTHPRANPATLGCIVLTAIAAALGGCEAAPEHANRPPPPKPDDVEAVFGPREPTPDPDAPGRVVIAIHRLTMRLDDPADDAWALVDESAFPPLTQTVWNANGMRFGILEGADLAAFSDALPAVAGFERSQLVPGKHPTPLVAAPRQRDPITVDLTIPPRAVREETLRGGRIRMLAQFTPRDPDGDPARGVTAQLTPHHHVPKVRLTPADPFEAQLDGRVFTELALRAELPVGKMLVIGLYRPPAPPAAPAEEDADPADTDGPQISASPQRPAALAQADTDTPTTDPPAPADPTADPDTPQTEPAPTPPLPANLGRAMLAGRRHNRDVQLMVIISAEPPRAAPAAAGAAGGDAPPR